MKATNFVSISWDQFHSGQNLSPRLARARESVERTQASMAELAAKDGGKDDFDPTPGNVRTEKSDRWDNWHGPRSLTIESAKLAPETQAVEFYERCADMESPYGDTGATKDSFSVDPQGREHYSFYYEFNGAVREHSQIIIDKSGNLVELFGQ
jgi:hypothetical protein